MSLPTYDEYKTSGYTWLPDVPTHWEVVPLKRVVALMESGVSVNAVDTPADAGSAGVLKTSCVYSGRFEPAENKAVLPEELHRVACPVVEGALIVSRMNTPALVGAAGLVMRGVSNLYLPDRLWQVHFGNAVPRFMHYWTCSSAYRAQVRLACAGTSASMQNLSQDAFLGFAVPLPPQKEQVLVCAFLDRETAMIDALIAEQQQLIALLAEKRQATISYAVTRGLNPDAPMKDSGVEWIGPVPAHWNIVKGAHLGVMFGSSPLEESDVSSSGSLPFIKVASLGGDGFEIENWDWFVNEHAVTRCSPQRDFVVFPKRGAAIFGNKVNIVRTDAVIDPNLMGWKMAHGAVSEYVCYVLKVRKLEELADVSTVPQINNKHIQPEKFPCPPQSEQKAIVSFLEREDRRLFRLRDEAHRAVRLLDERRSALITAAVTGQIDVRNAVPHPAAEPEPLPA